MISIFYLPSRRLEDGWGGGGSTKIKPSEHNVLIIKESLIFERCGRIMQAFSRGELYTFSPPFFFRKNVQIRDFTYFTLL